MMFPASYYSRTSIIWIFIIWTLGYPNAIINIEKSKDSLTSSKPSNEWNACMILELLGLVAISQYSG